MGRGSQLAIGASDATMFLNVMGVKSDEARAIGTFRSMCVCPHPGLGDFPDAQQPCDLPMASHLTGLFVQCIHAAGGTRIVYRMLMIVWVVSSYTAGSRVIVIVHASGGNHRWPSASNCSSSLRKPATSFTSP